MKVGVWNLDEDYINVELDWIDDCPVGDYLYYKDEIEVIS